MQNNLEKHLTKEKVPCKKASTVKAGYLRHFLFLENLMVFDGGSFSQCF
jgi:hypothetical protein